MNKHLSKLNEDNNKYLTDVQGKIKHTKWPTTIENGIQQRDKSASENSRWNKDVTEMFHNPIKKFRQKSQEEVLKIMQGI